jgi:hypothetical protein
LPRIDCKSWVPFETPQNTSYHSGRIGHNREPLRLAVNEYVVVCEATPELQSKLDKNFLPLFNAFSTGTAFSQCVATRSEDPGWKAILKSVSISELQVIDNVSPNRNSNGSAPYVEITLLAAGLEILEPN